MIPQANPWGERLLHSMVFYLPENVTILETKHHRKSAEESDVSNKGGAEVFFLKVLTLPILSISYYS